MTKRGPKTESGRKAVRQNARTHGIFSDLQVIPRQESEDVWQTHLKGIDESYRPETYMERLFVERIASFTWRLARLARFERDAMTLAFEGVSVQLGPTFLKDMLLEDKRAVQANRLIPEPEVFDKIIRYETSLQRLLMQTIHELEAHQAKRLGGSAPLARLDVTVSPPESIA